MRVKIRNNAFIINNEPVFLYGAEFHYFRCPKSEWSDRLDKIKNAGCNLVSTYIPWLWHEIKEGEFDFYGKTREERDLDGFLNLVKDKGLYCIVRPGPYIMAETKNAGIPEWLLSEYPEIIAKDRDNKEHPAKVITYQHPVFLEKVKKWYKLVNEIISKYQIDMNGPIIMYQLCNEIGMFHWVTNTSDYSEHMQNKFADYLLKKYGSVYKFNYNNITELIKDFVNGKLKNDDAIKLHYEWGRFWREYIEEYVSILRDYAIESGIKVPFIINIHGFKDLSLSSRGMDYPIGLSQLYKTAEIDDVVLAGDFYPGHVSYDSYHDLVLSCALTDAISQSEQPIFSAEFQSGRSSDRPRISPNDVDLATRTCIANGMNAINFYMFVSGENYDDIGLFGRRHDWQAPVDFKGNLRPHYFKIQHIGKMIKLFEKQLLNAQKEINTYIAFYPDYYMTEVYDEQTKGILSKIADERDAFFYNGIGRLLTAANISFDAYDIMKEAVIPVDKVPSLWIFSTKWMDEEIQKKLLQYVKDGGIMILYPTVPEFNLQGEECRILADALGIKEFYIKKGWEQVDVLNIDSVFVNQRMVINECIGEPVVWAMENGKKEYSGFIKDYGLGKVLMLGIGMEHDYSYKLDVIRAIADKVGIKPVVWLEDENLSATIRKNGENSFIFINNYDEIDRKTTIKYNNNFLFDGRELVIPKRSGVMLTIGCSLVDDISIVYSTMEIYDIVKNNNYLALFTKLSTGDTGEVVFKSLKWEPMRDEKNDVIIISKGMYKVKITGILGQEATILFKMSNSEGKINEN